MPIQLIPIAPDELAVFLEHIRPQYVAERMQADHLSRVEAEQFVTTQWQRTLPNGTATPGHHFFWGSLDAAPAPMGLLWLFLDAACRHAFINEIIVFDAFRRRGYGRDLLRLAETIGRERGVRTISLNVFTPNRAAIALYDSAGFIAVSQHMSKAL